MSEYLFIGGNKDGQRINVADVSRVSFPLLDETEKLVYEDYIKTPLTGNSKPFEVYISEGMTSDELMTKLLAGYRGKMT
jgi:hypothetical protein